MPSQPKKPSAARKPSRGALPAVKYQFMSTGATTQLFKVDSIGRKTRVASSPAPKSSAPKSSAPKSGAAKAKATKARPAKSPKSRTAKAPAEKKIVLDSNPFRRSPVVQVIVQKPSRR